MILTSAFHDLYLGLWVAFWKIVCPRDGLKLCIEGKDGKYLRQ